tara:strand:+ start:191 stop:397 length:207 start_codon:yes stop_codon:yes gene_type:complete
MNRQEVMDLMQFVIDSNNMVLAEATAQLTLGDQQRRLILNAVETKTKDCFFRMIELSEKNKPKSKSKK